MASRNVRNVVPSASTIGSSKRFNQPYSPSGSNPFDSRGDSRGTLSCIGTGGTGRATGAGVRAFPRLILVDLARPAGIVAATALHAVILTKRPSEGGLSV